MKNKAKIKKLCFKLTGISTALLLVSYGISALGGTLMTNYQNKTQGQRGYTVKGKHYALTTANHYNQKGIGSWYGKDFHGKKTANGEIYNMHAMTAASKVLPLGSKVRVKNLDNNKSVVVRVNDRGPFVSGRIIDLSYAAAKQLGYAEKGIAHVQVTTV